MDESMQSKGGRARAARMTREERAAASSLAAKRRWGTDAPKATNEGVLRIADMEIDCFVLDGRTRVLSGRGLARVFGYASSSAGAVDPNDARQLPGFLAAEAISSSISEDLAALARSPIVFKSRHGGALVSGYDATILPKICRAILTADKNGKLSKRYARVIDAAQILVQGLAETGIIALVDEATGFQYERARDELQKILSAYIHEELRRWVQHFPHEFFKQMFRLHGWRYEAGQMRGPRYVGRFINRVVYDQLPPGVPARLKEMNPSVDGHRKHRHHQFLTEDIGEPHLRDQISQTTVLMRAARDKAEFWRLFKAAYPKSGEQLDNGLGTPEGEDEEPTSGD